MFTRSRVKAENCNYALNRSIDIVFNYMFVHDEHLNTTQVFENPLRKECQWFIMSLLILAQDENVLSVSNLLKIADCIFNIPFSYS